MMTINNPYIKSAANIEWLSKNHETFLDWMAKHHSLVDCFHTLLDISTFDDNYVAKIIAKVEASDKQKVKEERLRKRKRAGKKVSEDSKATVIEKKQATIEEAYEERKRKRDEDAELPD